MIFEGFVKSQSSISVPDVGRNLVLNHRTANAESVFLKLGQCPHDNSCVSCRGTELTASRFFTKFYDF